ncbi:MAG: aminotransferase class I/II-fold pyridoxal phosphate-dependent enzyme [Saprospiraceae bacterium]|nr:aminotransferase class I/II-fold pyridoxal phosphate-dependent enzyme [Saprospiraceae bacterium]HPG06838.1 aminotransferase class I/II-fold pyridoxal phosphate-dependent enzyme [Saprospiraceae bacterium]HPR01341.1 aminotransferase class I/II-fold pyridoxal phosphate-dependent enzyme [Saprospiraceae bacterium]HQU51663.1 aminotransferase class I/II-fold pyridoxal phosphate-dependent enzyme [Saprospiraceae bacterium]
MKQFETRAIRLQTERSQHHEHSTPIFPTSSFIFDDAEHMRALFAEEAEGNIYSRFSNPSVREFELKMASLEGTEDAVATATGMAAIYSTLATLLEQGDHIVACRSIFGSSYQILTQYLVKWGISHTFVDAGDPSGWKDAVRPNSKILFIETPSNPGLDVIDLEWAAQFAHQNGMLLVVDNCFATPYLQTPVQWGADIITHSATKFIDGQGRVLGGVVCASEKHIKSIHKFIRNTGPSLSPFNAWVLSKSLETLAVRMDRHCDHALKLAIELKDHPKLRAVHYPFLPDHPGHQIALKQMRAGGGLLTFEVQGGLTAGTRFMDRLEMITITANLGDTRTIATHPASSTHSKLPPEERERVGITDGLIRVSVGLEHADDILNDIVQALD